MKRLFAFARDHNVRQHHLVTAFAVLAAIKGGCLAVLEEILEYMPEASTFYYGHGPPVLSQAVTENRDDLVEALLRHGAEPNVHCCPWSQNNHTTLLGSAARANRVQVAGKLLKHGARTEQSGAVQEAAACGHRTMLALLIIHGANVDERLEIDSIHSGPKELLSSWVPLHFAADKGQAGSVQCLLSYGADAEQEDIHGRKPRDLAIAAGMVWPDVVVVSSSAV